MIRALLVIAIVLCFGLALWGMRVGWRHRLSRQSDLPPLPDAPAERGERLADDLDGVYVGTAFAASWQERVVARGLGLPATATASVGADGVRFARQGAAPVFIPAAAITEARLAPGLAGHVVGAGGLLVIRWRLGDVELDTGFRADDKSGYPTWVRALTALAASSHGVESKKGSGA